MVFTKICKHSSRAFIFASKSSDHICLASSEHFVNFQLAGISMLLVKCGKKRFVPGHIWPTPTKAAFKQHTTSRSLAHESGSEWTLMRRSTSFLKRKSDNINTPRQEDKIYQTNNSPKNSQNFELSSVSERESEHASNYKIFSSKNNSGKGPILQKLNGTIRYPSSQGLSFLLKGRQIPRTRLHVQFLLCQNMI